MAENELANCTILCAKTLGTGIPIDYQLNNLVSPKIKVLRGLSLENRFINHFTRRYSILSNLNIPDSSVSWFPFALSRARGYIKKHHIDAVISFSTPATSHLVASYLSRKFDIPWVAYFSDPINGFGLVNSGIFREKALKKIETRIFKGANKLVFTNPIQKQYSLKDYSKEIDVKSTILPHAFNEALYKNEDKINIYAGNRFNILYTGIFYGKRNPKILLDSLVFLRKYHYDCFSNLRIIFLGSKSYELDHLIKRMDLQDLVEATDPVPYLTSLSYMKNADLLLVYDAPNEVSPFLPSKLIDYIGANKPIFGITPQNSPTFDLLTKANQYVTISYSPEDIGNNIYQLWNQWLSGNFYTNLPDTSIRNKYSVEVISAELINIINSVTREN
jgi:glycosyltransferase involved in cell wall biosynthesis